MPEELAAALAEHRGAFAAFRAVTPTLQREFILWFGAAKSSATRERRLRIGIPRLMERARRSKLRRGLGSSNKTNASGNKTTGNDPEKAEIAMSTDLKGQTPQTEAAGITAASSQKQAAVAGQ